MMLIGRAAGRGAFKGAALVGAFGIIVAAWWWDASVLTAAADANLQLIKIVTSKLPFDWGSKCRKRAADFRRRSRPLAHRGCRHRQSRHAQHRLPLSPPAVKAKRLHDFESVDKRSGRTASDESFCAIGPQPKVAVSSGGGSGLSVCRLRDSHRLKTESFADSRWRETDSNHRFRDAHITLTVLTSRRAYASRTR